MPIAGNDARRQMEQLAPRDLAALQLAKLNQLLERILPDNAWYAEKLRGVRLPLQSLEALTELPLTTKTELQGPDSSARNRSFPAEQYVRLHRTSGTHGRPLVVMDTAQDWQWWIETWQFVLDAAELTAADRVFMAFSFGPFVGFWSAFDAITHRGAMAIPGGGLSSLARLELLDTSQATVLCCTPTYALRLAEVAQQEGISIADSCVSRIIVAGEPGGSVPAIRQRIETAWNARVVDHTGATEVGPWGYADAQDVGLHIIESEFIAEFRAIDSDAPAAENNLSELVMTTLGRSGAPVIRYRTGDLVRPSWPAHGNRFVLLTGGVLGRIDDMLVIRGVNIYPSAVEEILRSFPEVAEYRITATKSGAMDALAVEVEDARLQPERIATELHIRLGLHVPVNVVATGSLPRFEAKGKRFVDRRNECFEDRTGPTE